MRAFTACVLKLTAVCNLDCTYCYMFNLADRTHRRVPAFLSLEAALCLLDRITAYADTASQADFDLTLHGGEPTMWPLENFVALFDRVEQIRELGLNLRVSMQTNAYKIDPALLPLLLRHRVSIGVSVDGPRIFNDRYRIDHSGRGSYEQVMGTVRSVIEAGYESILGGFLIVAQPEMEPREFMVWLEQLPVHRVDVLWPIQFHHANPPWQKGESASYARSPRFGKWFCQLFDLWWERDDPNLYIRLFFHVIEHMFGAGEHIDAIVNDQLGMFVVNTDGAIEYPDYFRACTDGGCRTRFNVFTNALDELPGDPGFSYCLSLGEHLPGECLGCAQVGICGGGFLPGRMKPGEWPPKRKSVLCADQFYFFSHVDRRVRSRLSELGLLMRASGSP